jgi:hypothetical protein
MKSRFFPLFLVSLFIFALTANATHVRIPEVALIYNGPGACSKADNDAGESGYTCALAASVVATAAGLKTVYVSPDALTDTSTAAQVKALFKDARVWIQPGGNANRAYDSLSSRLITELKNFIAAGGGYVGFCSGAFMATEKIGDSGEDGLSIFPGSTTAQDPSANLAQGYSFEPLTWQGKKRSVYFEGGPSLEGVKDNPAVEKIAYYADGDVAAARAAYHHGHVFLTGAHPEAPAIWSEEDGNHDPDGIDHDLATSMVKWAAAKRAVRFTP